MLRNFERISNDVYRVANIITIFNTLSAPPPSTISWTTAHLAGLVSVASSLIVYISLKCIKNTQSRIPLLPISDSGVDVVRLPWTPPQHPHPTANIRVLNSLRCQKCCLLSLHSALLPYYETRLSEPGPPLKTLTKQYPSLIRGWRLFWLLIKCIITWWFLQRSHCCEIYYKWKRVKFTLNQIKLLVSKPTSMRWWCWPVPIWWILFMSNMNSCCTFFLAYRKIR